MCRFREITRGCGRRRRRGEERRGEERRGEEGVVGNGFQLRALTFVLFWELCGAMFTIDVDDGCGIRRGVGDYWRCSWSRPTMPVIGRRHDVYNAAHHQNQHSTAQHSTAQHNTTQRTQRPVSRPRDYNSIFLTTQECSVRRGKTCHLYSTVPYSIDD
jgi:hypothetical protein